MTRRVRTAMFGVIAAGLVLAGCGASRSETAAGSGLSEAEFVRQADAICAAFIPRFEALPEGIDGAKPVGTGRLMHELAVALGDVSPPQVFVSDWNAFLDLFDRAAAKLDEAERAELDGRPSDAQSEALWSLEPRAARKFLHMRARMHVNFVFCRFGEE